MIGRFIEWTGGGLYTLLAFIVVLGIIIFVHEFGHFITAKLFRMRVFIFSFGFGKRLWGFRRGDTDYRVSLVPLGGYVKLEGEQDDFLSESTARQGDGKDFLARPRWQRFLVYLAGPLMNGVLTLLILWVLYMGGLPEPSSLFDRPVIGVADQGQPAAQAGLLPGDEIQAIDGASTPTWLDALNRIQLAAGRSLTVRFQRDGQERETTVRPVAKGRDGLGDIGVVPMTHVLSVERNSPAAEAGLKKDDGLLAVENTPVRKADDVAPTIAGSAGKPVRLRIYREGRILEVSATPRLDGGVLRIGIGVGERVFVRKYGPVAAMGASLRRTAQLTRLIADFLRGLLTRRVPISGLGGPLRIAQESGNAAREGWLPFFAFIAFISLNVGLLNLFPLVPLDGGHLLLLAVEGAARRDLSMQVKAWLMNAGAAAVLLLIAVVIFFDLSRTGLFGKFWH
jgi:regulator of sigma E protease